MKSDRKNIKRTAAMAMMILLLGVVFFILVSNSHATGSVVINEIAWMGTLNSTYDEWLELYNNTNTSIDLTGWKIISADGQLEINLSGQIAANGYFLLERTDDTSAPSITADQIYNGALNNSGENLKLLDNQGALIDEVDASSGWPAGDNSQKLTMERTIGNAWQNSQNPGGTPGAANSPSSSPSSTPSPSPSSTPSPSPSPSSSPSPSLSASPSPPPSPSPSSAPSATPLAPQYQYSNEILLNEFLPRPPKDEKEWVEIFNSGQQPVNLNGWKIADKEHLQHPPIVLSNVIIQPKEFLTFDFENPVLNNEGDQVNLIWPDGQVRQTVSYQQAQVGMSSARLENGEWVWTNQPTPGSANQGSFQTTASQSTPSPEPVSPSPLSGESQTPPIITTQQDSVAPPKTTQKSTPQPIGSETNELPLIEGTPTPQATNLPAPQETDLTAAAYPQTASSRSTTFFWLIGIIVLSAVSALGLIYFKRQRDAKTIGQDKIGKNKPKF